MEGLAVMGLLFAMVGVVALGSSGKTCEKTPRQRTPQGGLVQGSNDDKRNHYSHLFRHGGVALRCDLESHSNYLCFTMSSQN